ncbi:MAG: hypothetical protein ACP6IP_01955 [Candidatus Njordarchaeia archaeon]
MILPQFFNLSETKIVIDQALVTSGGGTDYDIKARSAGINKSEATFIYKKAMPPIYLGVDSEFKNALRVFNVSEERVGLSYITLAGRDELNRPGRLRAHILVMDRDVYEFAADPLFFSNYFISEDLSGSMDRHMLEVKDFLANILEHFASSRFKIIETVIKNLGEDFFTGIYSAMLKRKKVVIYGGDIVDVFSIDNETKGKMKSVDVLRAVVLLAPPKLKSEMEYTSYSSDFAQDTVNLVFSEKLPSLNIEKKSLIVDMEDGEIYNRVTVSYVKDYVEHIFKALEAKKFLPFLAETHFFLRSFYEIIEIMGKKEGYKAIRDLLALAQELQIELA